MRVQVAGSGTPVVLLHGAGVSGWMWRPTMELLGPQVQPIVPDLPGFGRSAHRPYVSHSVTVEALSTMIERQAPRGAHVVGFSLGAQLAIRLAADHPCLVRSVAIISGETKPAPLPGPTMCLLKIFTPLARQRWFAKAQAKQLGISKELVEEFVHDSAATSPGTLLRSVSENIRFVLPENWRTYPGHAAVLVGAKERALMRDSAHLTADALPGATLTTVEGAGHDIPFSRPDVIADVIHQRITADA